MISSLSARTKKAAPSSGWATLTTKLLALDEHGADFRIFDLEASPVHSQIR